MKKNIHYAWIILLITFASLMLAQGIRLSFGAFLTPWEEAFQSSRAEISAVALVSYLVFGLFQPFIGRLIDRIGAKKVLMLSVLVVSLSMLVTALATKPWHLMLIYGIIASVGFGGASNVLGTVVVTKWFSAKRGLAIGMMTAGTASGQFLIVPLSIVLIHLFGWSQAVMMLGLLLLVVMVPVIYFFYASLPEERGLDPYGGTGEQTDPRQAGMEEEERPSLFAVLGGLFRRRAFLFLLLPFFVCGFTTSGLIDTHLVPFAEFCGFSAAIAGTAVSALALFNFGGTILSGYLSDKWDSRYMLGGLYGIRALTIVILLVIIYDPVLFGFALGHSFLLMLFSVSFGVVDFSTVAPTMNLASLYFPPQALGFIIGLFFFSHQVGAALGAYVPGVLFDLTGGYDITFYMAMALCILASCMSFLLPKQEKSSRV
ncbi:MFS transporter [Halalkalibacter oceani]|uniref:MFS transporter n=1 Tax=Halalkalibacter oceani TaxID=1653776 RepID=UPI003393F50C